MLPTTVNNLRQALAAPRFSIWPTEFPFVSRFTARAGTHSQVV